VPIAVAPHRTSPIPTSLSALGAVHRLLVSQLSLGTMTEAIFPHRLVIAHPCRSHFGFTQIISNIHMLTLCCDQRSAPSRLFAHSIASPSTAFTHAYPDAISRGIQPNPLVWGQERYLCFAQVDHLALLRRIGSPAWYSFVSQHNCSVVDSDMWALIAVHDDPRLACYRTISSSSWPVKLMLGQAKDNKRNI